MCYLLNVGFFSSKTCKRVSLIKPTKEKENYVKGEIMDIFGVLSFVGGLAMFLYGMSAMGDGLTKLSGGKLEYLLEKLTSKRIMAVLLGAGVTAVIQSSSATTVMVVGFVNSGIMKLNQAVGIIMGANIGTTITSWILSLTGIQGDNVFIKMLNPSSFSPILAIIGVFMLMLAKSDKKKNVGTLLTGFSILMFGMHTMSSAVSPLADVPEFTGLLVKFSMPVLGVLAGTILTAVIQSSSASVGILQALCATGSVSYAVAIPIIMGQNIVHVLPHCSPPSVQAAMHAVPQWFTFILTSSVLFFSWFSSMESMPLCIFHSWKPPQMQPASQSFTPASIFLQH